MVAVVHLSNDCSSVASRCIVSLYNEACTDSLEKIFSKVFKQKKGFGKERMMPTDASASKILDLLPFQTVG
ncbi:hypothetical protein WA1_42755 [Scytonema hofmannii PCC 7110]|uniref:Uncharacterized protein n=1 Tax=Scytonema hofmannii PCC 7110 TaxID=128403 RepID=A0A139WVG4_9CYAN|nr:hypothetical protein WA1_42755 [Scytonema hofmannii PCC 7110]